MSEGLAKRRETGAPEAAPRTAARPAGEPRLTVVAPASRRWSDRLKALAARLWREPIAHFVALGAALALASQLYGAHQRLYRIEVTPAHVAELSRKYALQFGYPPDKTTLEALVQDDLKSEILYRQGLAERLDKDDEIIRRRVVQKEGFLVQNLAQPREPGEAELARYYARHTARYAHPARVSFSHVYFAVDHGDAAAEARAKRVLATLKPGVPRAPEAGDPFPDLYDFSAYEPEQVERLFGHTPFAQQVFTAPVGRWSGPYRSAFGWHLVYVAAREPAGQQPFAAVRDRVREDWMQDAQDRANAEALARIARKFTIVRRDQGAPP